LKTLPSTLEELCFTQPTRAETDEVLCVLQNDDDTGRFRHTLTTIRMSECMLNEDDLELLMFDIRERFPKLHTIDVSHNVIKTLCGIEDRINRIQSSSFP
jgi:hypothetical protein